MNRAGHSGVVAAATLVVLIALACGEGGPSEADKEAFREVATHLEELRPEERLLQLVETCARIPSCAGACAKGLEAFVSANPSERMQQMSAGCRALAAAGEAVSPLEREGFVRRFVYDHVARFAQRIEVALLPFDQLPPPVDQP